jgi:hypothetical protein
VSSEHVESVEPGPNETALRQTTIVAHLEPAYTGVLVINGDEIPLDQLSYRQGRNVIEYTPGKGTETGALKPGPICANVVYWLDTETRAQSLTYQWCWQVH